MEERCVPFLLKLTLVLIQVTVNGTELQTAIALFQVESDPYPNYPETKIHGPETATVIYDESRWAGFPKKNLCAPLVCDCDF